MRKNKIRLVILGCPKNQSDAESVAGYLSNAGFEVTCSDEKADAAIILTCAFVKDAEDEAMEHLMELIGERRSGKIGALVVTGCMPQRHKDEDVRKALPEVDAWVGAADYPRIASILQRIIGGNKWFEVSEKAGYLPLNGKRMKLGLEPFAYVKVSEGCRNRCAYCTIPSIRGDFRSRPMAQVVRETQSLVNDSGIQEIVLVGQDTALYGADIYGAPKLAVLLKRVAKATPEAWIRVMYSHPAHLTDEAIDAIAEHDNICPYFDIPIQHAAPGVLKRMGRPGSQEDIRKLIRRIRERIPGVVLRTTVMVGFPGETEREFRQLIGFIKEIRFERLGAFPYSREEGTRAYSMPGQVSERVKQRRLDEVMRVQQEISWDIQQDWVGRELDVLVDGPDPDRNGCVITRSVYHAPEVDAGIFVERHLQPGEKLKVRIIDALPYDLEGVPVGGNKGETA